MLHYRLIRAFNHGYPMVMMGLYIGAMFLALALMFIFPPGTLLLLGLGLASLGIVVLVARVMEIVEHASARWILRSGACPTCGRRMQTIRDETRPWTCEWCEHTFATNGGID
ncbi:MAG: hypothetical protein ACYTGP_10315 [Planctomycetota bacterium]|jgi:predicted RNA-binding Zn-ribbon protein involved in translation (DUF1610 family)